MQIFRHRPFALTLALFLLISVLLASLSVKLSEREMRLLLVLLPLLILLVTLALAAYFLLKNERRERLYALLLSAFLLLVGFARIGYSAMQRTEATSLVGETVTVTATVFECESATAGYTRYRVRVESVNSCGEEQEPFFALFVINEAAEYHVGDRLSATVETVPLSELGDPAYAMADGCVLGLLPVEVDEEESPLPITVLSEYGEGTGLVFKLFLAARSLQSRLSFTLTEGIGGDAGALAAAVLLGDRRVLDPSAVRDFGRAGLAHLLAVSGLHMTILFGGLAALLQRLLVPRRAIALLTLILVPEYLFLTGFSASACRAGIMLITVAWLSIFAWTPDPMTSLFLAGAVMVLVTPSAALSVGLWLSFSSVLGLLVLGRRWETYFKERMQYLGLGDTAGGIRRIVGRILFFLLSGVGTSLIASFSILPVLYLAGMEFSVVSLPSNLLSVFLMPIFLVLSLLYLLLSRAVAVHAVLSFLIRLLGGWLTSVASFFSDLPYVTVSLRYPFTAVAVAVFFVPIVLILVLPLGRRRKRAPNARSTSCRAAWLLAPVCAAVLIYGIAFPVHAVSFRRAVPLPVSVVHVTDGEHLVYADGSAGILVDLSDGQPTGYRIALDVGKDRGVTEWKAIVLTHYHTKTTASLARFCRENMVRCVYLPEPMSESDETVETLLRDRLGTVGVRIERYGREEPLSVGDLTVSLSRAAYREDSVQPIFYVTLASRGARLQYRTGALEETGLLEKADREAENAVYLLYGSDGPSRRENAAVPVHAGLSVLSFGDAFLAHLDPDSRALLERGRDVAWRHAAAVTHLWEMSPFGNDEINRKGNEHESS